MARERTQWQLNDIKPGGCSLKIFDEDWCHSIREHRAYHNADIQREAAIRLDAEHNGPQSISQLFNKGLRKSKATMVQLQERALTKLRKRKAILECRLGSQTSSPSSSTISNARSPSQSVILTKQETEDGLEYIQNVQMMYHRDSSESFRWRSISSGISDGSTLSNS